MKEWKGLPRTTLCYYKMIEDEGVEWDASSHLLLPKNGRNGGVEGAASNHILLQKICAEIRE